MTLDQQVTRAVHHVADRTAVPEVDLDAVRSRARANRRRTVGTSVAAAAIAATVVATALFGGREASRPVPVDPIQLPHLDGAPRTPYWHEGVLHVGTVDIKTPYAPSEVAGGTILVNNDRGNGPGTTWALVRDDQLTPISAGRSTYPQLSVDGRIVVWRSYPTPETTRYVAWDTATNRELASRTFEGTDPGPQGSRLYVAGIDVDGIAYVLDEVSDSDVDVFRWDVLEGTYEPAPGMTAADMTYAEGLGVLHHDQFVSPDGTHLAFTGPAQGDSPQDCCVTQLRIRPVGSEDPGDVVRMRLPEGVPEERLWDAETDEGTLDVWWETNQSLLLETTVYAAGDNLVRCSTTDGSCELVFALDGGPWHFARFPVTG